MSALAPRYTAMTPEMLVVAFIPKWPYVYVAVPTNVHVKVGIEFISLTKCAKVGRVEKESTVVILLANKVMSVSVIV